MQEKIRKKYKRIESYLDFVHYCLRRLGGGAVNIEVTDEQIQDRVTDALQYYREYSVESTQMSYWVYEIQQIDCERGHLDIPLDIIDIIDVKTRHADSSPIGFDDENLVDLVFWNNFWGPSGAYSIGFANTGLIYYEMTMQELEVIKRILTNIVQFTWRPRSNELYLYGEMFAGNKLLLSGYKMIDPETNNDIWDSDWLKSYATALIGIQWGTNVSKFGNIPSAGGITLSGDEILQRYTQEKQSLEEQFDQKHMEQPLPMWG